MRVALYQFTQWLDYYGKVWDKAVVSVSPHFTSLDCSNCGFRVTRSPDVTSGACESPRAAVKKSLSTRTHKCPKCHRSICRDTNAALNILKKGMSILGARNALGCAKSEATSDLYQAEYNNSTQGHWETADLISETLGETPTSVNDEKSEFISCVNEPRISNC